MDPVKRSLPFVLFVLALTVGRTAGEWGEGLRTKPSQVVWKSGPGIGSAVLRGEGLAQRTVVSRLLEDDTPSPQPAKEPTFCNDPKDCGGLPEPSTTFLNILDFGAVGDGKTNSTSALLQAIRRATAISNRTTPVTIVIPANGTFRLWPFSIGAAKDLTLQIDGDVVGPGFPSLWPPTKAFIQIQQQTGFKLQGKGRIDLDGAIWGRSLRGEKKPVGILVTGCSGCVISGISLFNSPATQIVVRDGTYVTVADVTVSVPDDSKESGGVELSDCKRCTVVDSRVKTSDVHVLLGDGCDGVVIHNCAFRGRGKGVTVAAFGADVRISRITVRNSVFVGTYFGVRIISRVNDRGTMTSVLFRNLTMESVEVPIVINQLFGTCGPEDRGDFQANLLEPDMDECHSLNERTGVAISNVTFSQMNATIPNSDGKNLAGVFRCSNVEPCEGLILRTVKVSLVDGAPNPPRGLSFTCSKAFGQSVAVSPPSCLDVN